uniref:Uncharacterized protein n=1 Tax=viral metagenome TaxID=1070528 RepID=A0A6M3J761_9ZZZZ
MHTLLSAIKTQLQSDLTYVRDRDIYITPSLDWIEPGAMFPNVGIKDGRIVRVELAGGYIRETLYVGLAVYVDLQKDEASVMGDASTGKKGVLQIAADIHESLDENTLDISGMQKAVAISPEPESELVTDEKGVMQRKIIYYMYEQERLRWSQN